MEGKKRSSKEVLEEKQMKRYFRSVKRAKGKNRKDNKQFEVEEASQQVNVITNVITNANVKEEAQKPVSNKILTSVKTKKNKTNKPTVQEKLPNLKQECVAADFLEDLADWETVPLPNKKKEKIENKTSETVHRKTENNVNDLKNSSNQDTQDEIIDQNKLWVEEMNKVNEKMSSNLKIPEQVIEKTSFVKNISKRQLVYKDMDIEKPKDLKNNIENLGSLEKEQNLEFSPMLYWRNPFPDITPLEVENTIEKKRVQEKEVKREGLINGNVKTFNKNERKDINSDKGKVGNLKSIDMDQHCLGNVWLEKSKYDDAENRYYQKLAKQNKTKAKPTQEKHENDCNKPSNHIETVKNKIDLKVNNTKTKQTNQKKQMINKLVEKQVENDSLESQLERLETENTEFKKSLTHLNCYVKKLEVRVRTLESGSRSSSMTDEGVDMDEDNRSKLFEDCVCNSDSDDKSNLDNISLNDGSEFEEFIATSSSQNCEACNTTLWKDDWEESSGQDLVAELNENCRKNKNSY